MISMQDYQTGYFFASSYTSNPGFLQNFLFGINIDVIMKYYNNSKINKLVLLHHRPADVVNAGSLAVPIMSRRKMCDEVGDDGTFR